MSTTNLAYELWRYNRDLMVVMLIALLGVPATTNISRAQSETLGDQSADTQLGIEFFEAKIRPLLIGHCYECHSSSAKSLQAGLHLDSREGIQRGGDSGAVIDLDQPTNSRLLSALRYEDLEMPPDQRLPDSAIADVERWIRMGAPDPRKQGVPVGQHVDWPTARQFWSFQQPSRPAPPTVTHQDQVVTAIDAFVLRKLETHGLSFNPRADRRTLIHRLYLDLIGLPPTPSEVAAFLQDRSPTAYQQVIDRLLSSPHYGERWGRHWLDVAGYAESNGIIGDGLIPFAWRYRDYVVSAMNKDKPYDRFLLEQFAGDEIVDWRNAESLTPEMIESLTATGFLRCTPDGTDNQNIYQLEKRWDHIHATVEVAMKAAVGLVFNCARCHDHKFDPVLQEDYYRIVGLFLPAYDPENWLPCTDFKKQKWPVRYVLEGGRHVRDEAIARMGQLGSQINQLQAEQRQMIAHFQERWIALQADSGGIVLSDRQLAALHTAPKSRDVETERIVADLHAEFPVANHQLRDRFEEFAHRADELAGQLQMTQQEMERADMSKIWALWDVSPPPPSHVLVRGEFTTPGASVTAGIPRVLDDPDNPFVLPCPSPSSSGYRLALARWLVRPQHPLTSRVIVNRIWHYHFGRGIVATPDDFGSQGAAPTHPELLDWLATELTLRDWSIKSLHREIVNSAVYCQSSQADPHKSRIDPDNRLLSRSLPRRLEAEAIRDCMLAVSDQLDRTLAGPSIPLATRSDGQYVVPLDHAGRRRRSLYVQVRRTTPLSFLEVFDSPQMDTNVPHRFSSTVPLQSLTLMNNPFVVESAQWFARRLCRDEPDDLEARIRRGFELAYGRPPDQMELDVSRRFVAAGPDAAIPDGVMWETFCHGLLASNEFLYVK